MHDAFTLSKIQKCEANTSSIIIVTWLRVFEFCDLQMSILLWHLFTYNGDSQVTNYLWISFSDRFSRSSSLQFHWDTFHSEENQASFRKNKKSFYHFVVVLVLLQQLHNFFFNINKKNLSFYLQYKKFMEMNYAYFV